VNEKETGRFRKLYCMDVGKKCVARKVIAEHSNKGENGCRRAEESALTTPSVCSET
jgi:hypothetical protein